MTEKLPPTTVVGSYLQPNWLVRRDSLGGRTVPRIRKTDFWNVAPELLDEDQNDATVLAIRALEQAGIDIISDGEIRRESYSNRFVTALAGIDTERPAKYPVEAPAPRSTSLASPALSGVPARCEWRTCVPAKQHRPHHQGDRAWPLHHVAAASR